MTTPLFEPPPVRSLPLVRGGDLAFLIRPKAPATEWPASVLGAQLEIDVEVGVPTVWDGVMTPTSITFRVESEVTDVIKANRLWRVKMLFDSTPVYNPILVNGRTKRYDG